MCDAFCTATCCQLLLVLCHPLKFYIQTTSTTTHSWRISKQRHTINYLWTITQCARILLYTCIIYKACWLSRQWICAACRMSHKIAASNSKCICFGARTLVTLSMLYRVVHICIAVIASSAARRIDTEFIAVRTIAARPLFSISRMTPYLALFAASKLTLHTAHWTKSGIKTIFNIWYTHTILCYASLEIHLIGIFPLLFLFIDKKKGFPACVSVCVAFPVVWLKAYYYDILVGSRLIA